MRNRQVFVVAGALALIGLAVFVYKWRVVGFPLWPGSKAEAWHVEAVISFDADGGPIKLQAFLPQSTDALGITIQGIIAPGFGLSTAQEGGNRWFVASKRAAQGPQGVRARFVAHSFKGQHDVGHRPPHRLAPPALDQASLTEARALIAAAEAQSSDDVTLVTALLKLLDGTHLRPDLGEEADIERREGGKVDKAVAVLALANVPARRVNGLDLSGERKRARFVQWLEAYVDDQWVSYSLTTGDAGVPDRYLAWWRGPRPFARLEGGKNPMWRIGFEAVDESTLDRLLALGQTQRSTLVSFSLFGLPLATQSVYRVLLSVPLGILVLVLLRNVVGLRGFGTFMPVLIALAFRETHLAWGLALFTAVVSGGLVFRLYLEQLKLLLVPRLAAVLIFVVLMMAGFSVLIHGLGIESGLSIALFPMVILTMTIERVSIMWDELGAAAAIRAGVTSLIIAAACYLLMTHALVEHVFFTFPELLLVILATTLVLGRYTGYRLLELKRFRVLAERSRTS